MIMTKGYKTSEFWLSLVAILAGAILSSGAIENSTVLQGLGLVASTLAALGYAGSRAITKAGDSKANAIKHIGIITDPKQ
jgi:drug/metabolite transporter (DMT)-like permease|tara:strand:+ start:926 stop:1165 length:240 start_codon:yes stop_codon:yes gene_type:complete